MPKTLSFSVLQNQKSNLINRTWHNAHHLGALYWLGEGKKARLMTWIYEYPFIIFIANTNGIARS
jgi:hypothetical protein